MFYSPHQLCQALLNHPSSLALMCGVSLPAKAEKELLLSFGLLHFFVISGAHASFIKKWVSILAPKTIVAPAKCLSVLCLCLLSNFQAPILRVLMQDGLHLFSSYKKLHLPPNVQLLLSCVLTAPIAFFKTELFSLSLSFFFHFILLQLQNQKGCIHLKIYMAITPSFYYLLGFPHFFGLFLVLPVGFYIGQILMPLAALSLFFAFAEAQLVLFWNLLFDFLNCISIFFGSPPKPKFLFENFKYLNSHLFIAFTLQQGVHLIWKRLLLKSTNF